MSLSGTSTFLALVRSIPSFLAIKINSFRWGVDGCGTGDALPAGSVITHYNTFIPKGCKVPWALRGGMRLLRKFSVFSPYPCARKPKKPVCTAALKPSVLLQCCRPRAGTIRRILPAKPSQNLLFLRWDKGHGLERRCHTMSYPRASASCTVRCKWIPQENGANHCVRTYSQSSLSPPGHVFRYVRTQRITRKHRHIRGTPAPRSRKIPAPGDRRRWSHCCSIRDCTCSGWQSRHR